MLRYWEFVYTFVYTIKDNNMAKDKINMRIAPLLKIEIIKKLHKYGFKSLSGLILYLLINWNEQNK